MSVLEKLDAKWVDECPVRLVLTDNFSLDIFPRQYDVEVLVCPYPLEMARKDWNESCAVKACYVRSADVAQRLRELGFNNVNVCDEQYRMNADSDMYDVLLVVRDVGELQFWWIEFHICGAD